MISAPLVVFYTAGYRYQFGSTHIIKTGVLTISSIPKNASIILDNVLSKKRTPAVIDNLFPGQTTVRIEKPEYSTWEKTLQIESGVSVFIANATLFLNGTPEPFTKYTNILTASHLDENTIAYLTKEQSEIHLRIHNSAYGNDQSIWKKPLIANATYSLIWSPDGQYILVEEKTTVKKYILIHPADASVVALPFKNNSSLWWDIGSPHELYAQTQKGVDVFGIDTHPQLPKNIKAENTRRQNGRLVVIQSQDQSIVSYVDETGISSIVAYLPVGSYKFVPSPSWEFLLNDPKRNKLILIDPAQKNPILLQEDATIWQWAKDNDRLLFTNGYEAKIFSVGSKNMETITRFSDPITKLMWYPTENLIVYSQLNSIKALELDRRDKRNETTLVEGYTITDFWMDKEGLSLIFLGNKEKEPVGLFKRILQK